MSQYISTTTNKRKVFSFLKRLFISFLFLATPITSSALTILGAAQAPFGADDIDVNFTHWTNSAGNAVLEDASLIAGSPQATITGTGPGKGRAVWQGAMNAGTVYGWGLKFKDFAQGPATVTDWYFTNGGNPIGTTYNLLSGSFNLAENGTLEIDVINPSNADILVSGFEIFVNQDPLLEENLESFITTDLVGSAVLGIPSSFLLSAGEVSHYTTAAYPDLMSTSGSLVAFQGLINGDWFRVSNTVTVSEPISAALFVLGLLVMIVLQRKRSNNMLDRKEENFNFH
jgi:hypothetical protein